MFKDYAIWFIVFIILVSYIISYRYSSYGGYGSGGLLYDRSIRSGDWNYSKRSAKGW